MLQRNTGMQITYMKYTNLREYVSFHVHVAICVKTQQHIHGKIKIGCTRTT